MARLFILFLIALLPLRGWTAERMVFQMDHGTTAMAVSAESSSLDAAMSEDCALHMQMAAPHGPDHDHTTGHSGCQACQLCMPLAALDNALMVALTPFPQAVPVPRTSHFASADTARQAKPPIS